MTETVIQQEIMDRAAHILRGLDEGKKFDSLYFRAIANALDGVRESDHEKTALYLQYARKFQPEIAPKNRDFVRPNY